MKKEFLLFLSLCLFSFSGFSQTDTEPTRIEKFIKKEKGKYGVWDKIEKKWDVLPEYDKITGIAFTAKEYETMNRMFFKLMKGTQFDLLRVKEKDFKNVYKIWVKDITEIRASDKKFESDSQDWFNFIFYKQNGKWGWFAETVEVLRSGHFAKEENVLFPPRFDSPPKVTSIGKSMFYPIACNNHLLQVEESGNTGLFSLAGQQLVAPGPYKAFRLEASIDYSKDYFIFTEGTNNLTGYVTKVGVVPPLYTSIEKKKNYPLNLDYFDCVLPNMEHEFRRGTSILPKEKLAEMEKELEDKRIRETNAYNLRKQEEKMAEEKAEAERIMNPTVEINPFDVVKLIKKGSAKELLKYAEKAGQRYTSTLKNGTTNYNPALPFVWGLKSFSDSKSYGIAVSYTFKDRDQKIATMNQVKTENYTPKEISNATVSMTKDGVDIVFMTSGNTCIISKSSGPGQTQAELDSAAAVFQKNTEELTKQVEKGKKSREAMIKSMEELQKAADQYKKENEQQKAVPKK